MRQAISSSQGYRSRSFLLHYERENSNLPYEAVSAIVKEIELF